MKLQMSSTFFPLMEHKERYLVLCGGAGSGKSEFAARKLVYRCIAEGNHRFLVLRKVRSRVRESALEVFLQIFKTNNIPYVYQHTERTISFNSPEGKPNAILFDGLDDPDKIKSIKGLTGVWLEEATEFTRDDFQQIDLRLREPGPHYQQIIMTFNPDEARAPWIKERFFDKVDPDAFVHFSTVEDNPIPEVREKYMIQLDKIADPTYRKIYRLGQWALARGIIFNWDVQALPEGVKFDSVFYGGDFGYSVDPATLIKIYRKGQEYWLEELLYKTGMTNQDIGTFMLFDDRVNPQAESWWDCAEPKSIEEIFRMGINAKPAPKGPDSVRTGIDFLKSCTIHIVPGSDNIIKERRAYKFKEDKNGNPMSGQPVEYLDHAMSAVRYGIYSENKRSDPRIW